MKFQQLQTRFYSREEIGQIVNINTSNNQFARKIKTTLTNWGYSYTYSRKGVQITRIPTKPIEVLKEILIRVYGLDTQIDTYKFAVFIIALSSGDGGFISAPWEERSKYLKEVFDVEVTARTLQSWNNKLIKTGTVKKSEVDKSYWRSYYVGTEKFREEVSENNTERKSYWKRFWELQKVKDKNIFDKLWKEFGCCYYSCSTLLVSAWDDNDGVDTLIELANEVFEQGGNI